MPTDFVKSKDMPSNTAPDDRRVFDFGKSPEEMTPRERSLANLRKMSNEGRRVAKQKQRESMMLDKKIQQNFKKQAKAFQKVLADIPPMSSLDVIRMCVHLALQENDYETAAKWAKELAEYEKPKLQRVEKVVKNEVEDMSEEELIRLAIEEGLLPRESLENPTIN